MHALALVLGDDMAFSPFIVPVAGCAMILGIVVAGIRQREMQSQERLAAIAKGVAIPPSVEELAVLHGKPSADTTKRRGNTRRGGIVLLGVAAGLILFFVALAIVVQNRYVLAGAAAGLIPLGIGVGLLVDARIQSREIADAVPVGDSTGMRTFE